MINFPSTGHPLQPTNRLLLLPSRSQGSSKESLDPLPTTSYCSLLAFYQNKKQNKERIQKMPILQFLIPPLPLSLEPPPTRFSYPALQLPVCVLLNLTVSLRASPRLSVDSADHPSFLKLLHWVPHPLSSFISFMPSFHPLSFQPC